MRLPMVKMALKQPLANHDHLVSNNWAWLPKAGLGVALSCLMGAALSAVSSWITTLMRVSVSWLIHRRFCSLPLQQHASPDRIQSADDFYSCFRSSCSYDCHDICTRSDHTSVFPASALLVLLQAPAFFWPAADGAAGGS
jgi:hypothetical protein